MNRKVDLAKEVWDNFRGITLSVLETHIEYHRCASGLRNCIQVRVYLNQVVPSVRRVSGVNGKSWCSLVNCEPGAQAQDTVHVDVVRIRVLARSGGLCNAEGERGSTVSDQVDFRVLKTKQRIKRRYGAGNVNRYCEALRKSHNWCQLGIVGKRNTQCESVGADVSRISRLQTKGACRLIEAEPVGAMSRQFVMPCQTVLLA